MTAGVPGDRHRHSRSVLSFPVYRLHHDDGHPRHPRHDLLRCWGCLPFTGGLCFLLAALLS
jgi:hypothetical protein